MGMKSIRLSAKFTIEPRGYVESEEGMLEVLRSEFESAERFLTEEAIRQRDKNMKEPK